MRTTYSKREFQKILADNGWQFDHITGSHTVYKKPGANKTLSVALRKCNKMVIRRLIKEFDLKT